MFRAGRLRHYVSIERNAGVPDGTGQIADSWTPLYANVPAGVEPLRGRERIEGAKETAQVTTRIVMYYAPGILPDMRIRFGARTFEIKSVIDRDERHEDLELMCVEVVR